jgi:serine phosphatase RsbU (regulator of sigma subunit)
LAWLVAIEGELAGRRFPLDAPCLVGRGPYNHIVLDDTRISRQHAKISPEAGGHVVHDLNSANGTFVNDVQIKRQRLKASDIVRIGPFAFRFEAETGGRTDKHPSKPNRFVEVMTAVGVEPVSIVDSMDAALATNPGQPLGLVHLEDADRKLRTLYAFLQSIATTLDTGELLERIAHNLLDTFPPAQLVVIYLRDGEGAMEPRRIMRRRDDGPPRNITFPGQFHEEVVVKGRAILSVPTVTQSRRGKSGGVSMHAPLIFDSEALGVLAVRAADDGSTPFFQSDLDLLTGLAAQSAMALSNARMHQESLKQQRLQQDLLLAEQIQKSFLPRQLPQVEGIEFVTEYRPAYSVGGDFYDAFWLSYDRIGVFIGDVSGKGVSAALLMARISSDLRLAAMAESDPARALGHVNRIVLERRQPDIFVTGIYFTLDVKTHTISLANAGHLPPFVRRANGRLERVEGGAGTAIGIFDDAEYEQTQVKLGPGDMITLCTDGVIDATNDAGEQYGFEKLESAVHTAATTAGALSDRILKSLRAHVGDAPQVDDITLIVCGITNEQAKKRRDEPTGSHKPK